MLRENFSELAFRTSSGFSAQGTVASLTPVAGAEGFRLAPDAACILLPPARSITGLLSRKRLILR
jgi:hypothetical protein